MVVLTPGHPRSLRTSLCFWNTSLAGLFSSVIITSFSLVPSEYSRVILKFAPCFLIFDDTNTRGLCIGACFLCDLDAAERGLDTERAVVLPTTSNSSSNSAIISFLPISALDIAATDVVTVRLLDLFFSVP